MSITTVGGEYLLQLGRDCDVELVIGAFACRFVWPPAKEAGGVPKATALQVVEVHLAYEYRREANPAQVFALCPPCR